MGWNSMPNVTKLPQNRHTYLLFKQTFQGIPYRTKQLKAEVRMERGHVEPLDPSLKPTDNNNADFSNMHTDTYVHGHDMTVQRQRQFAKAPHIFNEGNMNPRIVSTTLTQVHKFFHFYLFFKAGNEVHSGAVFAVQPLCT